MFKKPLAHQSNATPIRSSARRQLISAIFQQFPALLGPANEHTEAVSEKDLAKVIVPEGLRAGNMETSGGVEGTLYSNAEGHPLWMTFGRNSKDYIPTLDLLALALPHPPLPILQIHYPLPPPLLTGAPLFVPALCNLPRPHLIPDVPKSSLVAFVVSKDNGLQVSYIGIGRVVAEGGVRGAVERRIRNINEDREVVEGRFCDVLCIKDDHLWDLGSKPTLPTFTLPQPLKPLAPRPPPSEAVPKSDIDEVTESMAEAAVTESPEQKTPSNLSSSDISTLLSLALLQTLSPETSSSPSFPIPASQLYSGYILPNRPAYIPKEQRDEVVIAKSEWKKLAKWMKEVGKDGLVKIKESKGEVTVQSFDPQHRSLQSHAPFLTVAEEDARAAKRAAKEAAASSGEATPGGKGQAAGLSIEELWRPSGGAISFWEAAGVDKSSLLPSSALKSTIDDYLVQHSLVDTQDHRKVLLDDELGKAVGVKKSAPGQTMPRDDIVRKLRSSVAWSVSIGGSIKKGALQPVSMAVKTRQGRKTVTLVSGLETFGVDIDEFAEELRKLCAGSASVQPLQGASPKLNLQEIMVQGSQVKVVTEALVARGVPKRWIKEAGGKK